MAAIVQYTPPDMRDIFYGIRKYGYIKLSQQHPAEVLAILNSIVLCLDVTYLTMSFYQTYVDKFQEKETTGMFTI